MHTSRYATAAGREVRVLPYLSRYAYVYTHSKGDDGWKKKKSTCEVVSTACGTLSRLCHANTCCTPCERRYGSGENSKACQANPPFEETKEKIKGRKKTRASTPPAKQRQSTINHLSHRTFYPEDSNKNQQSKSKQHPPLEARHA